MVMARFVSCLFLVLLFAVSLSSCEEASVGINFQYVFEKENFFGHALVDQPEPVVYKPSLVGKPGLPNWLSYLQSASAHQAYMYGTPDSNHVGEITLEIIALNPNTYQSSRVKVPISISKKPDTPDYVATFFLANKNIEDMLAIGQQQKFLERVKLVWSTQTPLVIHKLRPALDTDEGPRLTNPQGKTGVYVTVGSTIPFSNELLGAFMEASTDCINGTYVPFRLPKAFQPDFEVEWCLLELVQQSQSSPQTAGPKPVHLGDEYVPPALPTESSSQLLEFLLIVIPPLSVALIFVVVLGFLMCTCRGRSKNIRRTTEVQLTHHQGIRQASRQLRALSNRRDNAPSSSPTTPIIPHGANPAVSSVHSSPRQHIRNPDALSMASTPMFSRTSPPPYRAPAQQTSTPTTPGFQETTFSDPFDSRTSLEPGNAKGRPVPFPPPFMSGSSSRCCAAGGPTS